MAETHGRGWIAALRHRLHAGTTRTDAGYTVIETMVAIAIAAIIAGFAARALQLAVHNGAAAAARTQVHGTHLDTSSLLARDVKEATTLHTAEAHELSVDVIRDETCWTRDYTIDTEITVTTTYYEQEACRGPSVTKTETLVQYVVAADTNFSYFTDNDALLTLPIDDLRGVQRVAWDIASNVEGWTNPLTYAGTTVYTGTVGTTGTGEQQLQAKRAVLTVTTGTSEGRTNPVLSWSDPNPTGYVTQWVLFRAANPEGTSDTDPTRSTWQQVGPTFPVATTTWTDSTLPAGYTASYSVRPMLSDGTRGPASNVVVTGLRPVAPTGLTVTGQTTSLAIKWNSVVGATGYDVYRDGVLFAHTTALTYTDKSGESGWTGSGYGHAHYYRIVATNRWESLTTTGAQNGIVALGATIDQTYPRMSATRVASSQVGAFTAPAAPTITATPNADWTNTVARTYAAWVGDGPTSLNSVSRNRGWVTQTATLTGAFAAIKWDGTTGSSGESAAASKIHTGRPAGTTTRYQSQTCNDVGCSPWSATATALQRPPTPASCTTSGATTRSMTVTVNPTAMESTYTGYRVTGGTGAADGTGTQASNTFGIDRLTHSTTSTFTGYSRNDSTANGGLSDPVTCTGTTAVLGVAITGVSSTTRTINASMSTTNGSSSSLTLENVATHTNVASASFDPLTDGTGFTLTARNSDGYNDVAAQQGVSTQVLTAPGAPSCTISGGGDAPGTATLTASGGSNVSSYGYSPQKSRTGLAAGTYSGMCRSIRTDGYNDSYSGWVNSGSVTVTTPFTPSGWGKAAPECPGVGVYITADSPSNWQIRRSAVTTCSLRWFVTQAGASASQNEGDVVGTGSYTLNSGATAYTRTSGGTSYPMGPLVW